MTESSPERDGAREADLAFLAEARALLAASPAPDGAALAELQSRCQALAAGDDAAVADAAAIVELRVLGAILTAQAAEMRAAAARLSALARLLPPDEVRQN